TIGAGSVITAGSVVSGDIPPGVVAGGIPARVLRTLTGDPANAPEAKGIDGNPATNATTAATSARPEVKHRGVLIADFTIDELAHRLQEDLEAPGVSAEVAPYGQIVQALLQPPTDGSDFAVVWTRPDTAIPSFARLSGFEPVETATLLAEVDAFCDLVLEGAASYRFVFVPTWTLPPYHRGLGLLDGRQMGETYALHAMNLRLMDRLAAAANVYVLDAQRWTESAGKAAHSPKLWYMGKVPFHGDVFVEATRDLKAALGALTGGTRKLLVLDLDDTMWGGIVGDAGWENLRLGGHDAVGESFVDFQRAVKALTRRGIVLGIVSKNEEATALEAIRSHPEMILREGDFVGWRINWRDKAQNIVDLAADLNLGLQSVVFIDDNPVERARVRDMLPEVLVPEWPEDKLLYKSALLGLRCFDTPSLSKEDAERTHLYAAEKQREKLQRTVGSIDEWLKSLDMTVKVEPLDAANLQRTAQLLNKTNQMNLSTRRLTDAELLEWAKGAGRHLLTITVTDKFGDAGLTGIVSMEVSGARATIVDFVLSCRVMGRKVENTMVHLVVDRARALGATEVEATLLTTKKNKPCLGFFEGSGLTHAGEQRFTWDASKPYELPAAIRLEVVEGGR
ncbi:MAG: HAD-IIIC family phosphatase, partial [Polyangiales bacterium]